jgi:DNA-directed RNA polymerase subunit alpha
MERQEYRPLILPRVEWNAKTLTDTFGEVVAQPLEPGLGTTFGSAIRRALLGTIEGSAVTAVTITGVNNEFAVIPGIIEDAMQVALNIKQIVVRNKTGKPGTMKLKVTGEAVARVADIKADEHLELVNPELILAHVAPDGVLEIEFFVATGRGYQAAQWPEGKPYQEDGRIYLDAMFAPVQNVVFDVQKTRVGKDIDYDKVTVTIQTNGSETPVDVYNYAVSVLRTQLEHFLVKAEIPFNEISVVAPVKQKEDVIVDKTSTLPTEVLELLLKPIEQLELSVRAENCLKQHGVKRVLDLVNMPSDEVLKIKNFGRKSLTEVKEALEGHNLSFGMGIDEEDVQEMLESPEEE